ncbi:MAG: 3-deoxy-manno-octulosonate cytidylyltransferase [Oligoflexia bacterium]|nr:MAG: 3-deoxy-manno-octulosonate cytidylyltransferase [Oligoflexia bacterium]
MKVFGVIPARYGSTRFPGKPLVKIKGKELITWVIDGARQAKLVDQVLVATDDQRIAEVVVRSGVQAIMTDSDLPSGSDRIWAAVRNQPCDVILNIQGDEPLITGGLVDALVRPMLEDPHLEMATLAHPLSSEELVSENSVKVIVNQRSEALYFSRFPIPYSRLKPTQGFCSLKHIGMYAYRKTFLERYCAAPQAEIEQAESLEQLRALYLGARIKVISVNQKSWGVDTPEDVAKIEQLLGDRA